jgi:hypothetical protein
MDLTEEQLKQIGEYVSRNFDELIERSPYGRMRSYEITVIERVTRVEEELKSQRDLMMKQHEMTMFGFSRWKSDSRLCKKAWMIALSQFRKAWTTDLDQCRLTWTTILNRC